MKRITEKEYEVRRISIQRSLKC